MWWNATFSYYSALVHISEMKADISLGLRFSSFDVRPSPMEDRPVFGSKGRVSVYSGLSCPDPFLVRFVCPLSGPVVFSGATFLDPLYFGGDDGHSF